jgi:hypothetical protein
MSKFLPTLPRYENPIIDHSAMKEFKNCHRKYAYHYVLGKVPVESAAPLEWGTSYHTYREVLQKTGSHGEAMIKGAAIWTKAYPNGVQEDEKKWQFYTLERLYRSFGVAYAHVQIEQKQDRIKVIGTEVAFNVELPDGTKTSGRVDQLIRWNGQLWGRDFKTTSKEEYIYKRSIEPNDQIDRYTYAESVLSGEQVQGQLIEIMFNTQSPANPRVKKEYGPLIYTLVAARSKSQIDTWVEEQGIFNEELARCRSLDIWPKNESNCGFCPYHMVCTSMTTEGMVAKLEDESFYITRVWDNTRAEIVDNPKEN